MNIVHVLHLFVMHLIRFKDWSWTLNRVVHKLNWLITMSFKNIRLGYLQIGDNRCGCRHLGVGCADVGKFWARFQVNALDSFR